MGAQGTTTVDFGAFPGNTDTTVTVAGQTGILSNSLVEVWLVPVATTDHSADEHLMAKTRLGLSAGSIVAGSGFTITATWDEPAQGGGIDAQTLARLGPGALRYDTTERGSDPRMWGQFTVGWVWN